MADDEAIALVEQVGASLERLSTALRAAAAATLIGDEPGTTCGLLAEATGSAFDDLSSLPQLATVIGLAPSLRRVRKALEQLRTLGFEPDRTPSPDEGRSMLRAIPRRLGAVIAASIEFCNDVDRSLAASSGERADAEHAIDNGIFMEHVTQVSDRGYLRAFPPFEENVRRNGFDEHAESWTLCEVLIYPNDKWVIRKTDQRHRAVEEFPRYEELIPADAAMLLLSNNRSLGLDDRIWLREVAREGQELAAGRAHALGAGESKFALPVHEPSEALGAAYSDPDNYLRNVWFYEQRKAGKSLKDILRDLRSRPEYHQVESENAVRGAIESIARHHGWEVVKGVPGRPRAK